MSKTIKNRSKVLLAVNLGDGQSAHLRPKESVEISDVQAGRSEVVKHLAKGRLVIVEAKKSAPKVAKAKVSPPPAKADTKPEAKSAPEKDGK